MEPFIVIAIAAVALVVFFIAWNRRSEPSSEESAREPDAGSGTVRAKPVGRHFQGRWRGAQSRGNAMIRS